jgi:hypothetical protein
MEEKLEQPPWKPDVRDNTDLSYFDPVLIIFFKYEKKKKKKRKEMAYLYLLHRKSSVKHPATQKRKCSSLARRKN